MLRQAKWFVLSSVFAFGLVSSGCDSAGTDPADQPQVVAPAAFEVDLFEDSAGKTSAGENLTAAVLRYVPVSVALGVKYLLVPKVVTELATAEEPTLVDDQWVWEAESNTAFGPITFTLTGRPSGDIVDWSMVISGNNAYTGMVEEFELYTARTSSDGSEGTWELFYKIEGESVNVLDAEFEIASPVEKQITFSVPETAPEYPGYEVRYQREGNDRTFYWNQPDSQVEHTITWNPEAGIGSIQSTNYKDGARYCWNDTGADVACQ